MLYSNDGLRFVVAPGPSVIARTFIPQESSGLHCEVCPDAAGIVDRMSRILEEHGGSSLIIDYGEDGSCRHSLRVRIITIVIDIDDSPLPFFFEWQHHATLT